MHESFNILKNANRVTTKARDNSEKGYVKKNLDNMANSTFPPEILYSRLLRYTAPSKRTYLFLMSKNFSPVYPTQIGIKLLFFKSVQKITTKEEESVR